MIHDRPFIGTKITRVNLIGCATAKKERRVTVGLRGIAQRALAGHAETQFARLIAGETYDQDLIGKADEISRVNVAPPKSVAHRGDRAIKIRRANLVGGTTLLGEEGEA